MLFIVIAKDGTDEGAPARRRAVRQQHLEGVKPLVESGFLQLGGALMKEDTMIGSVMVVEAESEAKVWEVIQNDIYVKGDVWQNIEVYPFRRAVGVATSPAWS